MRKKKHPEHVNHERWLISYADFITLLFAFFVVMFAVSQVDTRKVGRFTESFSQAVGIAITPNGAGLLPAEGQAAEKGVRERGSEKKDELKRLEKALLQDASAKIELAGLKVIRRGNELVLRLDATVLFESGVVPLGRRPAPLSGKVSMPIALEYDSVNLPTFAESVFDTANMTTKNAKSSVMKSA